MASKLIDPTEQQYQTKVLPLSTPAWIVYLDVKRGTVCQMTAGMARSVSDEEWQALDFIKIIGGVPFDETNFQVVTDLAAQEINDWLNSD